MSNMISFPDVLKAFGMFVPFAEKVIAKFGNTRDSKKLQAQIRKANSYFKAHQYDLALKEYQELARRFPTDVRPRLGEITVLRKQEKSIEAVAVCGMALEISRGDPRREARVYNTMGAVSHEIFEIHKRKKDLDEAIGFFGQAKRRQNALYTTKVIK